MKLRQVAFILAVLALAFSSGCETRSANAETLQVATPPATVNQPDAASPAGQVDGNAAAAPVVGEKKPATTTDVTVAVPDAFANPFAGNTNAPVLPHDLALSPALADVVKLIQAGVNQDVVLAYITNSTGLFNIGSKEILYLHDLGTPVPVLTVLIQRDSAPEAQARRQALGASLPLPPGIALNTPATNIYPTTATLVAPPPEPIPVAPPEAIDTTSVTPPLTPPEEPVSISNFESELAPYGSWVYVNGYGNCWRPTVSMWDSDWQPYVDGGRWLWTDAGWYWYSDYSWGWAPFHYGRWFCPPGLGWVWYPDTCWGPSWVSWRYSAGYCGWAPLPPSACWINGYGFYHPSFAVGIGCEFGLTYSDYCFVSHDRFCDRRVGLHTVHGEHARHAFDNSRVVNNYVVKNRSVVNNGAGIDHIAAVTRGNVKKVALRDTTDVRDLNGRRERLATDGQSLAVVRPGAAVLREGASPAPQTRFRSSAGHDNAGSGSAAVSRPFVPSRNVQQSASITRPEMSARVGASTVNGNSADIAEPSRPASRTQASRPFAPDRPSTRAPIIITGSHSSSANQNSILASPNTYSAPVDSPSSLSRPSTSVSRPQSNVPNGSDNHVPSRGVNSSSPLQQREARVNAPQNNNNNNNPAAVSRPNNAVPSRPSYSAPASAPTRSAPAPAPSHNVPSRPSVPSAPSQSHSASAPSRPQQSYSAPQQSAPAARSAPAQSSGGGGGRSSGGNSGGGGGGGGGGRGGRN